MLAKHSREYNVDFTYLLKGYALKALLCIAPFESHFTLLSCASVPYFLYTEGHVLLYYNTLGFLYVFVNITVITLLHFARYIFSTVPFVVALI